MPRVKILAFPPAILIVSFPRVKGAKHFAQDEIRRRDLQPKTYTEEEDARAEAEMDAWYLREHGELPEKPKKDG